MSTATINPAPAPSSERRAAANRRNAQKSTGPRTPEGKARVALNALKHGVTARTPFIPSDDPDEFADLTRELLEDLDPRTALERELADRIVGICWRRRRLWRAEEEIIARAFGYVGEDGVRGMPAPNEEEIANEEDEKASNSHADARMAGQGFLAEQFDRPEGTPLLRLAQHERRLNGAMDSALRLILKLQDRRERMGAFARSSSTKNKPIAASSELLLAAARRAGLFPDTPAAQKKPIKNAKTPASSPVQNKPIGNAPAPVRTPVQNKANGLSPDHLAPARRGELPPVPRVAPTQNKATENAGTPACPPAPNEAVTVRGETQPHSASSGQACGLALKGGVRHGLVPVLNKPTVVSPDARRAPAQNKAIAAAVAATAAEAGWVGTIAQVPAYGGVCEPPAVPSSAPVAAA
jgi:hypothetical protein